FVSFAILLFHSGCGKEPVTPDQGNGDGKKQGTSQEVDRAGMKSDSGLPSAEVQSSAKIKPLKVLERTPSPGKNDVVINDPIAVVFSEAVDAKTAEGAFTLMTEKGDKIAGHVICKDDTVIFKTDNNLEYGVKYKVRVSRKITGRNGGRIPKDIEWNFATNQAIMARL
ncbi:MAG TPA: Ig-like domain-containing protein, partial [Spirochaetota bacterium]|nr:Ig-like domain-containing protein [Spirochaetota bacterium]